MRRISKNSLEFAWKIWGNPRETYKWPLPHAPSGDQTSTSRIQPRYLAVWAYPFKAHLPVVSSPKQTCQWFRHQSRLASGFVTKVDLPVVSSPKQTCQWFLHQSRLASGFVTKAGLPVVLSPKQTCQWFRHQSRLATGFVTKVDLPVGSSPK
jgi:hypothetical protein